MALALDSDGISESIVRKTGNRQQRVAGLEHCKKCSRECMRAVYKAYADKRSLRAEHLSVDLIKHFPANIVITVAACSGKA